MSILKNLIIAIVIGLIIYEVSKITLDGGFALPTTTPEISLALLFILTSLISLIVATQTGSGAASDREQGTVKWFNVRKGYGFITRDSGDDVFVHFRNIEGKGRRAINEGERVSFVVTTGEKGLQADKVKPA